MYAKFNLNPDSETWSNHYDRGKVIHDNNKIIVENNLDVFKNADNSLKAKEIIENWFPKIKADVFLSHSHKDERLVVAFAGWLSDKFGIASFIDSTVWGYSDQLLREIDNKYCQSKSGETYDYNLRNRSTSHVHMMLSTALADMIDQCECVIFVNTPNSFKPVDYFKSEGNTESPWIYSEIAMTRILRKKSLKEHRPRIVIKSTNTALENLKESRESLSLSYEVDLLHLIPLSVSDLTDWEYNWRNKELQKMEKSYALDSLYFAKGIRHAE